MITDDVAFLHEVRGQNVWEFEGKLSFKVKVWNNALS